MADSRDAFTLVCHRMQTLMREQPVPQCRPSTLRLDDMIQRLGSISDERQAA